MRILFTNNTLAKPAGTEVAIRDLAVVMQRRGHEVTVYSPQWGEVADTLLTAGIPVVACLDDTPWVPDLVHGHHQWETTLAALRWPQCPVISFCRGVEAWQEEPCRAPNVVKWVAIDKPCLQRILRQEGIPAEKTALVLNGIDLGRFQPRQALPKVLRRALVFSNYAQSDLLLPELRAACEAQGIECEAAGAGVGRIIDRPEQVLVDYDLVFAKGKAALEAVLCGCAVIVCDVRGLGPLVTQENFNDLRNSSFGFSCMTQPVAPETVRERIRSWTPETVEPVVRMARESCGLDAMLEQLESIYLETSVMRPNPTADELGRFVLQWLEPSTVPFKAGCEALSLWEKSGTTRAPETDAVTAQNPGNRNNRRYDRFMDVFRKGQAAREELDAARRTSINKEAEPGIWKCLLRRRSKSRT